jgi:hypothetical protein
MLMLETGKKTTSRVFYNWKMEILPFIKRQVQLDQTEKDEAREDYI